MAKQYKLTVTLTDSGYDIQETNDLSDIEVAGVLSQALFNRHVLMINDLDYDQKKKDTNEKC